MVNFHPLIRKWFEQRFGEPTDPQRLGWPHIAAGRHTLIAAPTGSGKTLAAFLVCLDRLWRDWDNSRLNDGIRVVYVSPLKALSNDIERNLQTPLAELRDLAAATGHNPAPIRAAVRTGDTPSSARQKMLRQPPHVLVTTPESLFILLTSDKSRQILQSVDTVIVDEIHALARDKRGSHLALSLERLAALCPSRPVRIGLSATQKPIDEIAKFLTGVSTPSSSVTIVDVGHARDLDLAIETPPSELSAVCSHKQWDEVYERLVSLIRSHRSTLIFVNTRRLAERVSHHLREMIGEESVAGHHGSLSRAIRLSAELRLKNGQLKAIVATASLEMGIDIGYIDLVCQIGSPRSIATFLQRVGRSGHSLGATPKGRLFPLTRDELLECMALVRAGSHGELDRIEIPNAPLDILAQQIVACVACEDWEEDQLYELLVCAWPYRHLLRNQFAEIVKLVSDGLTSGSRRGAYLHRDQIHGRLRARRGARLAALTSGGAIPENAEYRVVAEPEQTFVGTVDEDFAIESLAGDVFLLGNQSWRIRFVRGGEVVVRDAEGAPPSIPFWFGEGPGRTIELSTELSRLRQTIADHVNSCDEIEPPFNRGKTEENNLQAEHQKPHSYDGSTQSRPEDFFQKLQQDCGVDRQSAQQAVNYVSAQVAATGLVPTRECVVFERFFDESGGMQLVIHSPLGARINRAWGLALRKRFCRSFDFELQAAATDNGILLSLSPQHSFPIDSLFDMLGPHNARHLLEQALLAAPMFQVRWRWNVTRSLAVLRWQGGKKVPTHLQRFRSDDLLAAAFPETVGCLENHHGDVPIPDHPLVRQTMTDCLHEAMDVDQWLDVLEAVKNGDIRLMPLDTREPSPFGHEILNANPYAFLDDAPLEERRTRAVATRRTFTPDDMRDLARLDSDAIQQVRDEAWPLVRDADELHDALMNLVALQADHCREWSAWFDELVCDGRATVVRSGSQNSVCLWIAAERWPLVREVYRDAVAIPPVSLPKSLDVAIERSTGWVDLVRGRMQISGPVTAETLAEQLAIDHSHVMAALESLEGQGIVLRGTFTTAPALSGAEASVEWCDRRLLTRIHRITLAGLRERIKPVAPEVYMRYLIRRHRLGGAVSWQGPVGLREIIAQLQGFEMPAETWEQRVLAIRLGDYDPQWLDQLFLAGEVMWGRLRPPVRDEVSSTSRAALRRSMPTSLLLREDLSWLFHVSRRDMKHLASSNASQVLDTLTERGALFFQELAAATEMLPGHLEETLRELAALGMVTCDGFAAVRAIVDRRHRRGRRHSKSRVRDRGVAAATGRWTRFPGPFQELTSEQRVERWCRQLICRYGVVFRDLLAREAAAPPWQELVRGLRRMELRGELRGGRFVSSVAGEQFAEEEAITQLRQMREEPACGEWLVLSAVDPLNLAGIIMEGQRISATQKNALILHNGCCTAAKESGRIEFYREMDHETAATMRRALQTGRRTAQSHLRAEWLDAGQGPETSERTERRAVRVRPRLLRRN